ncbi:hypothetical protein Tco_1429563, partial [Tanacetum coccineum]
NIDEQTEMQCLYLEKIKECECLANELSKRTKTIGKQDYNELLKSFSKLEQHSISLELALQQYKNIAISKLKKLIEKMKGKGVDTNFGKPLILGKPPLQPIKNQPVVRQPTAFQSERLSFSKNRYASQVVEKNTFTKPVTPHSWPQVRQSAFAKPYHVNAPGPSKNSSKHVSFQSPKESVGSNDMVHNYYIDKAKKKVNSRASAQKKDAQSHKTTKRYIPIEKKNNSKNHGRQIPKGQRFSPNKSSAVYVKTTPPRSGITWKPTGRIFTYVGLRWIPTRKAIETYNNTNDSALPLGKDIRTPNTIICANYPSLSACTSMASETISSKGSTNNEKIRTQVVLDLEDRRREKIGKKEWKEVRNTRAKMGYL